MYRGRVFAGGSLYDLEKERRSKRVKVGSTRNIPQPQPQLIGPLSPLRRESATKKSHSSPFPGWHEPEGAGARSYSLDSWKCTRDSTPIRYKWIDRSNIGSSPLADVWHTSPIIADAWRAPHTRRRGRPGRYVGIQKRTRQLFTFFWFHLYYLVDLRPTRGLKLTAPLPSPPRPRPIARFLDRLRCHQRHLVEHTADRARPSRSLSTRRLVLRAAGFLCHIRPH